MTTSKLKNLPLEKLFDVATNKKDWTGSAASFILINRASLVVSYKVTSVLEAVSILNNN